MKRTNQFATALLFVLAVLLTLGSPVHAAERTLSFAVPGVIDRINVKAGARVEQGTVLATLDQRPMLASKKAGDAGVEAAMLKSELMTRRLVQTEQLYDSLSASTENVEDAKTAAAMAKAALENAKAHSALATWTLQRSTLRSPFAGTVVRVPGYPGQVISENGEIVPVVIIRVP